MFFIAGISSNQKQLEYNQMLICPGCGKYCGIEVFITYMYFSLFFIPIIKWSKKYYVKSNCCKSIFTLSKELGSQIEKGMTVTINDRDIEKVNNEYNMGHHNHCPNCGYVLDESFKYCPNCATPIDK
jgi:hypothetical protein